MKGLDLAFTAGRGGGPMGAIPAGAFSGAVNSGFRGCCGRVSLSVGFGATPSAEGCLSLVIAL